PGEALTNRRRTRVRFPPPPPSSNHSNRGPKKGRGAGWLPPAQAGLRSHTTKTPFMTRRLALALGMVALAVMPCASSWADGHSSHSAGTHAMNAPYTGNSGVPQQRVTSTPPGFQGFVTFKIPKSWSRLAHYQFDVVDQSGLPMLFE